MPAAEPEPESRSDRKHRAIVDAASQVFLEHGYLGTNMDLIAAQAHTSKQTVYKHFGNKEALFIEIVTSMTDAAGDQVHFPSPEFSTIQEIEDHLYTYAMRQLTIVLAPELLRLRRLVIGEVGRFPELGRVLFDRGPKRAINQLTELLRVVTEQGLIAIDDPRSAAERLNWMIMAEPLNRAMLLGDPGVPSRPRLRKHARSAVRFFLAGYAEQRGDHDRGRRTHGTRSSTA